MINISEEYIKKISEMEHLPRIDMEEFYLPQDAYVQGEINGTPVYVP